MIDESLQEQAALYALGLLTDDESRQFETALSRSIELQKFVAGLNLSVSALAGVVPLTEPPPQLRAKILAQIEPPQKMLVLPVRKNGWLLWPAWLSALGFAVLCLILFQQDSRLHLALNRQTQQLSELNQLAQSLQSATNDLQSAILALQETNRLANLRITMLNSQLTDSPKTMAVTLWDDQKQTGIFVAENLKKLPTDKDYQLWVMDHGTTPVDAGIFHVNQDGSGRVEFKAKQPINLAGKFAVTEEIKGGANSPTLKNLVLLGSSL